MYSMHRPLSTISNNTVDKCFQLIDSKLEVLVVKALSLCWIDNVIGRGWIKSLGRGQS
jgi:hypothetical protein